MKQSSAKIHKNLIDRLVDEYMVHVSHEHKSLLIDRNKSKFQRHGPITKNPMPSFSRTDIFVLESKNMVAVFYRPVGAFTFMITIIVKNQCDTGKLIIDDVVMIKRWLHHENTMPSFSFGTPVTENTARFIWDSLCGFGMIKLCENENANLTHRQVCDYLRKWKDEGCKPKKARKQASFGSPSFPQLRGRWKHRAILTRHNC